MLGYSDGTAWLSPSVVNFDSQTPDTAEHTCFDIASGFQDSGEVIEVVSFKDSVEEQKDYINGIGASNR